MEWYQEWMEFETELTAEEVKQRLNDAKFLSGYDCTAQLLSNDRFYIASLDGSPIQQQFVFRGNIRKRERGACVVGEFGWSSIYYTVIGIVMAAFFAVYIAMGVWATGSLGAGLAGAIAVFLFMALLFGLGYVLDVLTKNPREVTWKDVKANSILYFIRRGLLPRQPEGYFTPMT